MVSGSDPGFDSIRGKNKGSPMKVSTAASAILLVLVSACGKGSDTPSTAAADKDKPAVGRCAVDAKDGAPYGKITEQTTENGELRYKIESKAANWNKKASAVKVVDC